MIILAWLTPSCISFLPIFLEWYTTTEYLQYRGSHPEECKFIVNHTYAIVSSSLTFWLPVLIMITLYYKVYLEARQHMVNMKQRQFSVPAMCFSSAIPSICSIGTSGPDISSRDNLPGEKRGMEGIEWIFQKLWEGWGKFQ